MQLYNISCVSVSIRPDDDSHLEPKHVAVNTLLNIDVVFNSFDRYTCETS